MSLTPLTLNMTVPRTQDGSQVQQQENMRSTTEHMIAHQKVQKETQQAEETVIKKQDSDFVEYHYDAKEKGNNEYEDNRKKKKKEKQQMEEEKNRKHKKMVSIDIKL